MSDNFTRKFTHEAGKPAILLVIKDGMIQKAVLYGSAETMVYVREEGRGGFGIVPTESATDFLAFDDLLTLEPAQTAAAEAQTAAESKPDAGSNGATLLAFTGKDR
jgi:hypothetical protein